MIGSSPRRTFALGAAIVLAWAGSSVSGAATGQETQARIAGDLAAGRPIVVHVVVALCDNQNQGIVPVPKHLGNGQDPNSNLYWGALYGVRTFFPRRGGWTALPVDGQTNTEIRERLVFFREVTRGDGVVPVYIVAEAWDGAEIKSAIGRFFEIASGVGTEQVSFRRGSKQATISAGGSAHLVAFVGHNGLMDFSFRGTAERMPRQVASSSIVLACASKPYFLDLLRGVGSHPCCSRLDSWHRRPTRWTLRSDLRAQGGSVAAVRDAAATAYHAYQRCGRQAARNLFWGREP